jgi:hypothetical protein
MFRTTSRIPAAAAAVVAAAVIAACGSAAPSSSTSSNSGGPPTQAQLQQVQQDTVKFSRCMRSHGVSNFPDPTSPVEFKNALSSSAAQAPAFKSARAACIHLLPGGGRSSGSPAPPSHAQIAAMLAFAGCLRGHGFPSFPDPTSSGQVTHEMLAAAGINLQQPAVLQAADTCVGVTHGLITKAAVARFVAGR